MRIGQALLMALIFILAVSGLATAEMYKYVDENGVVHYQDYPPSNVGPDAKIKTLPTYKSKPVVPDISKKDNSKTVSEKIDESKSKEQELPQKKKKKSSKKNDYKNAKVELYVTSWCKYCKKAASYFRSKGVPFTEYDIEKDKAAARRKNKLSPKKGVPFAVVNGRKIYGFAPKAYEHALKNR